MKPIDRFILEVEPPGPVLEIGPGKGRDTAKMREAGLEVTTLGPDESCDIVGYYPSARVCLPLKQKRGIWCSHVLEHLRYPHEALRKLRLDLAEGGILGIVVPPLKHEIVGGHLTLWNAGLLLYHLVLAGFDCRDAAVLSEGYNVAVIVRKQTIKELPELRHGRGDIEALDEFFPIPVKHGFDGRIKEVNW